MQFDTKDPYQILLATEIIISILILGFAPKEYAVNVPFIFWITGLILIINYGINYYKLSSSVKKRNPELFKKYSLLGILDKHKIYEEGFVSQLNDKEKRLLYGFKKFLVYFFICFLSFGLSGIIISLSAFIKNLT